jgi:hypothetical protein
VSEQSPHSEAQTQTQTQQKRSGGYARTSTGADA